MSRIQAVMFDMDGTLVDTEPLWAEAEAKTTAGFGYVWTEADRRATLGAPMHSVIEYMEPRTGASGDRVTSELVSVIEGLMATRPIRLQPGARRLHDEVVRAGIPVGLASNSWRDLIEIVLRRVGLVFDATLAGDEASANKPHPAPYIELAGLLDADPSSSVVIEDSEVGMRAGKASGAALVIVPEAARNLGASPGLLAIESLEELGVPRLRDLVNEHSRQGQSRGRG